MAGIMKSKKVQREEAHAPDHEVTPLDIPTAVPQEAVVKIRPIVTYNDWLVVLPFSRQSNVVVSAALEFTDKGIVVGKSETIMAANGTRVPSQINIGDVLLYQERSIIKTIEDAGEPYVNRKLAVISERNVFLKLPAVPFEIYKPGEASADDFTAK